MERIPLEIVPKNKYEVRIQNTYVLNILVSFG